MSQYLYKIQPVRPDMLTLGPTREESQTIDEHFTYLKRLMEEGVVILAGRTQNTDFTSFGIVLFNADSDADAHRIVQADPAVRKRVMRAEIFPYRIALLRAENAERLK